MNLTKSQAVQMFGSGAALGRALGITKGAISQWADDLDQKQTAMVIGAATQLGIPVPKEFIGAIEENPIEPARINATDDTQPPSVTPHDGMSTNAVSTTEEGA